MQNVMHSAFFYLNWKLFIWLWNAKSLHEPTLNFQHHLSNLSNLSIPWVQLSCTASTITANGQEIKVIKLGINVGGMGGGGG